MGNNFNFYCTFVHHFVNDDECLSWFAYKRYKALLHIEVLKTKNNFTNLIFTLS